MSHQHNFGDPIYFIEIGGGCASPNFTGILLGVTFFNGRGSTSSLETLKRAEQLGCIIRDATGRRVWIKTARHSGRGELLSITETAPEAPASPDPKAPKEKDRERSK